MDNMEILKIAFVNCQAKSDLLKLSPDRLSDTSRNQIN